MTRQLGRKKISSFPTVLAIALWLGVALAPALAAAETNAALVWPKAPGVVFALRNTHFGTPRVTLDAKGRDLMAYDTATRGRALVGRSFELVCDGGSFLATDAGTWIGLQLAKSNAFTIEVTLTPAEVPPKTRGVVLAYGDETAEDVALLQDKTGLSLRLWGTQPIGLFAPETGKSVHVLIACDKETWSAYRDGQPAGSGKVPAGAPTWGTRQLVMGAAWSGADPWRGRMEGIAVFPRVLTAEEAAGEAAAIKAFQARRKPAPAIRFRGTLVRQANTAALDQLMEYSRSMTAAEYKVEQVLAGEWKEPTITVFHWMIIDRKRLPIADRKPGTTVELSVERYSEHPELKELRRDESDDTNVVIVADFYCESETAPYP